MTDACTVAGLLGELATYVATHPDALRNTVVISGSGDDTWTARGIVFGPRTAEVFVHESLIEDPAARDRISDLECEVDELRQQLAEATKRIAQLEEAPTSSDNPIPTVEVFGGLQ